MTANRLSVWILGDQLMAQHPALAAARDAESKANLQVVLVESLSRARRLPYQRKKLVLLFSAMRHYADELRQQGYQVDYVTTRTVVDGLRQHVARWQPHSLLTMAASEYRGRRLQEGALAELLSVPVTVLPNTQFLVGRYDPYPNIGPDKRVVMEYFYRKLRQHFGVLITKAGEPVGGQWNYDKENRKPLPRAAQPPPVPRFEPDAITRQVIVEVEAAGHGVGAARDFDLAVNRQQALAAVEDFLDHRLADFGPYEDAMSAQHSTLYHSALSSYLNIGLLDPMELVSEVEQAYHSGRAPINSAEGFVRQVLGWREYIYWQYWRLVDVWREANAWGAHRPLPSFFWDATTDMRCLHHALRRVIDTGYTHHIERLMLICNFAVLAGIEPMAINDWFLAYFVDAYEWVMLPNVIGMGLNADGGHTATKPYIASANYVDKMSDYCAGCRYDRRQRTGPDACPYNLLYWNFLLEHEQTLRANPRLGRNVLGLRHLDDEERKTVRRQAGTFLAELR